MIIIITTHILTSSPINPFNPFHLKFQSSNISSIANSDLIRNRWTRVPEAAPFPRVALIVPYQPSIIRRRGVTRRVGVLVDGASKK